MRYVFANCELDTQSYRLRRSGLDVPLRPKLFRLLVYLLEQRHRVVTKQDLCEQVWQEQFVRDATLENGIKLVRQAVGDSGRAHSVSSELSMVTAIALQRRLNSMLHSWQV